MKITRMPQVRFCLFPSQAHSCQADLHHRQTFSNSQFDHTGRDMASDFAAYVLTSGAASPTQRRKPSHLMPPTEVHTCRLPCSMHQLSCFRHLLWLVATVASSGSCIMSHHIMPPAAGPCSSGRMPPPQVVAAQLDALQRNDWPEPDAGVRAAFAFSKPAGAEELLTGQVGFRVFFDDTPSCAALTLPSH